MFYPQPDPQRAAWIEETARQRRQRNLERAELMRKMDDDGSGVARRQSPIMVAALLVVVAATVIIVLVLAGMVHL